MIYEYECDACGAEWEVDQKITDPRLEKCPHCEAPEPRRLISGGTGFVLKGKGWFEKGGY